MSEGDPGSPGLFRSLRNLIDTGLEIIQNRIELFGVELQEERCRLAALIVITAVGLILGTVGALVLTAAVVLAAPQEWRVSVALVVGAAYLAGAALAFHRLHRRLKHSPPPFRETLGQIRKDREWLNPPR